MTKRLDELATERPSQEVIDAVGKLLETEEPFSKGRPSWLAKEWYKAPVVWFTEIPKHSTTSFKVDNDATPEQREYIERCNHFNEVMYRDYVVMYVGNNPDPRFTSTVTKRDFAERIKALVNGDVSS
jgi:hypothetical protein